MRTRLLTLIVLCTFSFIPASYSQLFGPSFRACILQSPELRLEGVKKIAIVKFENNTNLIEKELSQAMESKLPDYMTAELLKEFRGANENKIFMAKTPTNVYSIVERNEIERILEEQGRTVSGAFDESDAVEIGKLLGVDALIIGNFAYTQTNETRESSRKKKDGTLVYTYTRERKVKVMSNIKVVSIRTGEILGIKSVETTKTDTKSNNKDYPAASAMQSPSSLADKGMKDLAGKLVNYFAPRYQTITLSLKKVKIKEFKAKAKEANKLLSDGEIDRGYAIYKEIFDNDGYNPVAIYNLGVIHESVGNFKEAKEYYDMAFQLDEDDKAFRKAAEKAAEYEELVQDFQAVGIMLKKHNFDVEGAMAKANQVEIQGSSKDRISIYNGPDKSSEVVAKVPGGVDLQVIELMDGWYKVKLLGGKTGFLPQSDGKAK